MLKNSLTKMKNIVLVLIALMLSVIVCPIAFAIGIILSKKSLSKYLIDIAVEIDETGNIVCGPMFNIVLIKAGGFKFGDDETISSAIGRNKEMNTLSMAGLLLYRALNKIQPNHCENSILKNDC